MAPQQRTLTRWPHQTLTNSSHVSRATATLPAPPQSISVKERDGGPDTDLLFRLTFLSHNPGTRWTVPRGQPNTQDPRARR